MASGSCMCSQIGYEYTGEPATTALCHCTDCQKWTGGAYTANVVVPRTNFKITKGTPKSFDALGKSGKVNKHFFCGNCGSGLYAELALMPEVTLIKSGGLDGGANNHPIAVEFYTKDRLGYVDPIKGADQQREFGDSAPSEKPTSKL